MCTAFVCIVCFLLMDLESGNKVECIKKKSHLCIVWRVCQIINYLVFVCGVLRYGAIVSKTLCRH